MLRGGWIILPLFLRLDWSGISREPRLLLWLLLDNNDIRDTREVCCSSSAIDSLVEVYSFNQSCGAPLLFRLSKQKLIDWKKKRKKCKKRQLTRPQFVQSSYWFEPDIKTGHGRAQARRYDYIITRHTSPQIVYHLEIRVQIEKMEKRENIAIFVRSAGLDSISIYACQSDGFIITKEVWRETLKLSSKRCNVIGSMRIDALSEKDIVASIYSMAIDSSAPWM